jgi:putative nucleotidyltransferase with HDIG domain
VIPNSLRLTIVVVVAAALLISLGLAWNWPLQDGLGGPMGLIFWIAIVAVSAAAPVRMPNGSVVNVTIAPVLAVAVLGGPTAAALAVLVGTLEWRELRSFLPGARGGVPWYGTLYNQASNVIPAAVAGITYAQLAGEPFRAAPHHLAAVVVAGLLYFALNNAFAALAVGFRQGRSVEVMFVSNIKQFGFALVGLTPVAWLMATVYTVAGPVGILPFALPLYTTRSGYQKVVEIRDMFTQTVKSLASAVDAKDPFTAGHSVRVQTIAKELGREMRCSEEEMEALEWGGLLHDIGKIGIPDAILLKQGALTRHERIVMNGHPVKGEEIIRPVAKLAPELPIIRHHHEWYNGSGYPDHLVGEDIPKLARIMHVADAYEAMTAARPYRMTPLSEEQALAELRRYTGIQFDPLVVAAFERLVARGPEWARPTAPPPSHERTIPLLGEPEPQAA